MPALYKNSNYLLPSDNAVFDVLHSPGENAPHPGIYRCEGCGTIVAANAGNPLPSANHHRHGTTKERILWRLIVWA